MPLDAWVVVKFYGVCPFSVGVDRESHDALLAEVVRLETALGSVRQDLQGLMGCRDTFQLLDGLQETVRETTCTVLCFIFPLAEPTEWCAIYVEAVISGKEGITKYSLVTK